MMDKYDVLKKVFGFSSFRPGQEPIIDAILSGRDVLGILPTGSGKSACYQIPALLLPGVTLVISPLISLMNDQVEHLKKRGIEAECINSSMLPKAIETVYKRCLAGKLRLLYVAPERLTNERFLQVCGELSVSLVVIDEAHCVSQWGRDFRPDYLRIRDFVFRLDSLPVLAAFTASATPEIGEDIVSLLGLREPVTVKTGFDRPNLFFDVIKTENKYASLLSLLPQEESAVVYCSTRKSAETVCDYLCGCGKRAVCYHAGLDAASREKAADDFMTGEAQIITATNAFGMGIDKPDIRLVVHFEMPPDIESYYQQAGRAGRDGLHSDCILLYGKKDRLTHEYLIESSVKNELLGRDEQRRHKRSRYEKLDLMERYCTGDHCYRQFILGYFGQTAADGCDACGFCSPVRRTKAKIQPTGNSDSEEECLRRLKELRRHSAFQSHLPARLLISDRQLKKVVRARATDADTLMTKCDFSMFQMKKIGLAIIRAGDKLFEMPKTENDFP